MGSREVGWGMVFSEWGGWEGNKTLLHNSLSFLFLKKNKKQKTLIFCIVFGN